MKINKANILQFNKLKLQFYEKELWTSEIRVRGTKQLIDALKEKVLENDCKAHRESLEEIELRLEVLEKWHAFDKNKVEYYQYQIN